MRIVITGPTGAIGHALIDLCLDKGIEVLAICHRGSKRIGDLPVDKRVKIIELDMSEYDSVQNGEIRNLGKWDIFYHMAWNGTTGDDRNDTDLQQQNIKATLAAVRLAHKLKCHTFIGAGSQAEYGRVNDVLRPNTPTFPENGYGIAKLCAGQLSKIVCRQLGIRHIWVRILSVYGPYDGMNTMVISTIRKLLIDEMPMFTKGEQEWDYIYSRDAGEAMLALGARGADGEIYVLGSGKARPLRYYIEIIRKAVGTNHEIAMGAIPYSSKQVMFLCADIEKLTVDTGFEPKTSFEKGVEETVNWVKNII